MRQKAKIHILADRVFCKISFQSQIVFVAFPRPLQHYINILF